MPSLRSLVVLTATALAALSTASAAAVQKRGLLNALSEVKDLPINVNPSTLGNADIGNTAQLIPAGSDSLVETSDGVVAGASNLVTTADGLKGKRDVPALPLSSLEEKFRVGQETLDAISKEMDAAIADKVAVPGLNIPLGIIAGLLHTVLGLTISLLDIFVPLPPHLLAGLTDAPVGSAANNLGGLLEPGKQFPTAAASTFVKTTIEIVSKAQNALGPNVPFSSLTQTPVISAIDGFLAVILPHIEDKDVLLNVVCPMTASSYFVTLSKFCGGS